MKVLVIRTDRIGDLIVSTPVFKAIKDRYPDAHIAAMVSPYTADLLVHNPFVDEIIICDRKGKHGGIKGLLELTGEVRRKKFDVAITLHSRMHLGFITFFGGIPKRIAPATKLAQIFYNCRITQRRSRSIKHEADYNLELLAPLGINVSDREAGLWTDETHDADAQAYLAREGLIDAAEKKLLIGIHPGSGDSAKNWRPERYAELADKLTSKGFSIVLSGGYGERGLLDEVKKNMIAEPHIYLSGTLLNFTALLKRLSAFVSSSTGPMHMAAAVKTPTAALFCPVRVCTPVRWGPIGNRQKVFLPEVPQCEKCTLSACEYYECMNMIGVDAVADAVMKLARPE